MLRSKGLLEVSNPIAYPFVGMGKLETPSDKASLSKIQIRINFGSMDFAPRAYAERLVEAQQSL